MRSQRVSRGGQAPSPQAELPLLGGSRETLTKTRRFELFHQQNPEVWRLFVKFTKELIGRGFQHNSARTVLYRIRWDTDIATDGELSGFKINDHFSPFYARLFHRTFPKHDGFFHMRDAEADHQ